MPGLLFSSQTPLTISVIMALNKISERIFPCLAPLLILNHLATLFNTTHITKQDFHNYRTPCSKVPEKHAVAKLVNKFPSFTEHNVQYSFHINLTTDLVLTQMNPVCILKTSQIHFNTICPSTSICLFKLTSVSLLICGEHGMSMVHYTGSLPRWDA